MSLDQAVAFAILLATIAMFVSGRLPYDLVAMTGLLAGVLTGVVPADHAFDGFSNEVVIIIAAALLVSAGISRSGVVETLMRPILPHLKTEQMQVPVLAGAVALLSMVSKNVGALAIFMPVALQLARRTGTSPSALLMPMSFASLLGGLVTLIGTSPNILISGVRQQVLGKPFGMFAYAPVGLGIAAVGVAFLSFGYRLLPRGRKAASSMEAAFRFDAYVAEARLPAESPLLGQGIAEIERLGDGDVQVATIIRERFRRLSPTPAMTLRSDDVLLLQGEPEALERLIARARLSLAGGAESGSENSVVEGVVTEASSLVGQTPGEAGLGGRYRATLIAVSRSGERVAQRIEAVRLRVGDVVVLKGEDATLPDTLGELRILPLAERQIALGQSQRSLIPALVLVVAMGLAATNVIPVAIAFFGAAVVLLLLRVLTMEDAYRTVEWHVLFLLAALIPLADAVRHTGGTALIAHGLSGVVQGMPPDAALAVVLVLTMIVTPFLHNAPTVLILGPIVASFATSLSLNPDPFLMAVALGAGCDFLTPIGHQCNTLVLGPGGYRFGDYWRLGLPLSILVIAMGVPLIAWFWPLHPR